jgi:hypothetical protein
MEWRSIKTAVRRGHTAGAYHALTSRIHLEQHELGTGHLLAELVIGMQTHSPIAEKKA